MKARLLFIASAFSFFVQLLTSCLPSMALDKAPMNIVVLYADDWRHDTLGVAGNPVVQTPVLDQMGQPGHTKYRR